MSLFDRWMSNLGANKSSGSSPDETNPAHKLHTRRKSTSSEASENPQTPSHHSLPSTASRTVSLKAPQVIPSEESRVVRRGPHELRRKTLIPRDLASGDDNDEEDEDKITKSYHYPVYQPRILENDKPFPEIHKARSNNRFFQQGPLSADQIRGLFWVEEILPEDHYTQTARSLNIFRQRKRHCDVRIITEKGRFYCHKAVLVTFSRDLQNRLESSSLWKTGKISVDLCNRGFEDSALELVINWMYTGSIRVNIRSQVDNLLTVAEGLKISRLANICRRISADVIPGTHPSESQIQFSLPRAEHTIEDMSEIKSDHRSDRTKAPFQNHVNSEEFLLWSFDRLVVFLSADSLIIESELDVYQAAVRWINHNRSNRIGHINDLASRVRWIFMSAQEVIDAKHLDPRIFSESTVSSKAAMGQWQRDLLRRGIQLPLSFLPVNRVEQTHLRKLREQAR